MKRSYKWTYLYAAVEPTSGESFCMYLPGMDDGCLEIFLDELSKRYPDQHLLVVLDGAPSHRSEQIVHPQNVSFLRLPPRSPELDPSEAREMVSRVQEKFVKQDVRERGPNTRCVDQDAWPVLGGSFLPQAAHRILMVGTGGGGGSMTSIDRNGISRRFVRSIQSWGIDRQRAAIDRQ
ncbi:MAG: transposase [Rubrobacteraceae bacterium]|nr:transposase [Rubrobacteraceae bacterium]